MAELSSSVVSRSLWSKTHQKMKPSSRRRRKDPAGVLPVLTRRSSGLQSSAFDTFDHTRGNSLHTLLAFKLEGNNDQEMYSRIQLRAMASSKLLSTNSGNNRASSRSRLHSEFTTKREAAERLTLAPLDPYSFKPTRTQHRSLPEPLQAPTNEVLAVRTTDRSLSNIDDSFSDRGNNNCDELSNPMIPSVKTFEACKVPPPSRRPEWRRYIRRIMMTRSFRGTTLARYRRLVGIVARKNLAKSFAGAIERVVQYRLEFSSVVLIQNMVHRFLNRRRRAKEWIARQAAVKIQLVWRTAISREIKRKFVEEARHAEIARLVHFNAARIIQSTFRSYQTCGLLHQEQLRQQQQASVPERARLKVLHKYQCWRQRAKSDKFDQLQANNSNTPPNYVQKQNFHPELSNIPELHKPKKAFTAPESGSADSEVASTVIITNETMTSGSPCNLAKSLRVEEDFAETTTATSNSSPSKDVVRCNDHRTFHVDNQESPFEVGVDKELQYHYHGQKREKAIVESPPDSNQVIPENENLQENYKEDGDNVRLCLAPFDDKLVASPHSLLVENEAESTSESSRDNDTTVQDHEKMLSDYDNPHQEDNNLYGCRALKSTKANATAAARKIVQFVRFKLNSKRTARKTASQIIAHLVQHKLEANRAMKMRAALLIQCHIRSYHAKQQLAHERRAALCSLRTKLQTSWEPLTGRIFNLLKDKQTSVNKQVEPDEDEDEDFDFELEAHASVGATEGYLHLLPTRNGQVPPGVPLLLSSAGAPLLSLWKWSWPNEQWLSSEQWQLNQQT